jgi:hypothetical protein
MVQLHPQAEGFLSFTFYDSQGYGGGILTHLNMGVIFLIIMRNTNFSWFWKSKRLNAFVRLWNYRPCPVPLEFNPEKIFQQKKQK